MANIIQAKGKLNGKINSKGSVKGSANPSSGARSYGDLPDKPSINGVEISGDKNAEDYGLKPSDFVVNITKDYVENTVSADKTYSEILEAYNAGMDCYAIYDSTKIPLRYLNPGAAIFIEESLEFINRTEITIRSIGSVELNNSLFLPSEETYGLVKANSATEEDTLPVNIDEEGFLKVAAKPKDFVITIIEQDGNYTADSNAKIIYNEYEKGAICHALFNFAIYPLTSVYYQPPNDYGGEEYTCIFGLNNPDGYTNIILTYHVGSDTNTNIVSVRNTYLYDRYQVKDLLVNITNDGESYTADQSVQSIIDDINIGVTCYAIYNGLKYELQSVDKNRVIFGNVFGLTVTRIIGDALADRDGWSIDVIECAANDYSLGGVIADNATSYDTVPAKIGEDNKLYVPTYPTLESLNAQPKDFIVTISGDDVNGYTADKTYDEISEAYNAGKSCYANALGSKVPLLICNEYAATFQIGDTEYFNILSVVINSDDNSCYVDITTSNLAASTYPGIVYAQDATAQDTQPVNIDYSTGFLYTTPPKFTFNLTMDTETQTITADKTYAEIRAAYDAGRVIEGLMPVPGSDTQPKPVAEEEVIDFGNNPKIKFGLVVISDNKMVFYNDYAYLLVMIDNTNTWGFN